jgi:hypothetical protein
MGLPQTLTTGLCQRNPIYFNETFAQPTMRLAKATLYKETSGAVLAGVYDNLPGYSANGEEVGFNAEDCKTAAELTDPKALQEVRSVDGYGENSLK